MDSIIKKPSAWLPMAMSLIVLAILLVYLAMFGVVHETDEGIAAHLFQILIAGQVPIVAFFVVKWLPRNPKQTLIVLVLQILVALLPMSLVFFFEM